MWDCVPFLSRIPLYPPPRIAELHLTCYALRSSLGHGSSLATQKKQEGGVKKRKKNAIKKGCLLLCPSQTLSLRLNPGPGSKTLMRSGAHGYHSRHSVPALCLPNCSTVLGQLRGPSLPLSLTPRRFCPASGPLSPPRRHRAPTPAGGVAEVLSVAGWVWGGGLSLLCPADPMSPHVPPLVPARTDRGPTLASRNPSPPHTRGPPVAAVAVPALELSVFLNLASCGLLVNPETV